MQLLTPLMTTQEQLHKTLGDHHRPAASWVGVAAPFCPLQQLASLVVAEDLLVPVVTAQV